MSEVRIGVVGVGAMGAHHARILSDLPACELVGVVDVRGERAREIAERYGCRAFEDLDALLGEVAAAVVAVPTPLHHEIGKRCLEAGLDVLVEKPIASSLEEADDLLELAERRGAVLQAGHVERYNPAVEATHELVTQPGFIEVDRLGLFVARSLETDVLLDLMIHDIDVVHWLVGDEVAEIRAVGVPVLSDAIDIANARLEFHNGCIANLTASRVSANRVRKVRIFQPAAYLSVDYTEQSVEHYRLEESGDGAAGIVSGDVQVERVEPLLLELRDFVGRVRDRGRPRVDGVQARWALEVALRVRDVVERGPTAPGRSC